MHMHEFNYSKATSTGDNPVALYNLGTEIYISLIRILFIFLYCVLTFEEMTKRDLFMSLGPSQFKYTSLIRENCMLGDTSCSLDLFLYLKKYCSFLLFKMVKCKLLLF